MKYLLLTTTLALFACGPHIITPQDGDQGDGLRNATVTTPPDNGNGGGKPDNGNPPDNGKPDDDKGKPDKGDDGNNGHGNDPDRNDESNKGKGHAYGRFK